MPCSPTSFSPGYLYTVMYRILKSWLKSSAFFYKAPSQVKLKRCGQDTAKLYCPHCDW